MKMQHMRRVLRMKCVLREIILRIFFTFDFWSMVDTSENRWSQALQNVTPALELDIIGRKQCIDAIENIAQFATRRLQIGKY